MANKITPVAHEIQMLDFQLTDLAQQDIAKDTSLSFSAMGRDFAVQLQPSRLNSIGSELNVESADLPKLYQGTVIGDPDSWVRLSVHDNDVSGYLFSYGKLLRLESRAVFQNTHSGIYLENVSSELVLIEPPAQLANVNHTGQNNYLTNSQTNNLQNTIDRLTRAPVDRPEDENTLVANAANADVFVTDDAIGTAVTRAMRIGIVIDSRFDEFHRNRGLARALSIINSVDAIYQSQMGMAIIVSGISVYDDPATDPLRNSPASVEVLLQEFHHVRVADPNLPADLALVHLFSGHRDPDTTIGLGWLNAACRVDGFDLSMSTPFPFDTLLTAHEIGHNLGALHDDDPLCVGSVDESRPTLMWPKLSSASTAEFSYCSRRDMQALKMASCNLDNVDFSNRLRTYPSNEFLRRAVIIEVSNNDLYSRAAEAMTLTQFPDGTLFSDVSPACVVRGSDVECRHGTVQAQSTHSLSVTAELANQSQEIVVSHVSLVNAADTKQRDNYSSLRLLQESQSTSEATADLSPTQRSDERELTASDGITGLGSINFRDVMLLLLWFSLFYALRRTEYRAMDSSALRYSESGSALRAATAPSA